MKSTNYAILLIKSFEQLRLTRTYAQQASGQ